MANIHPEKFGKDHWSTFAYVETRCVDHGGVLHHPHMRDDPKYPTKLRGGELANNHSDYDCLDDLEAAGLLTWSITVGAKVVLTSLGWEVASKLRQFKAGGGNFADFSWSPLVSA